MKRDRRIFTLHVKKKIAILLILQIFCRPKDYAWTKPDGTDSKYSIFTFAEHFLHFMARGSFI
jgi:hypothetical protein